MSVEVLSFVYGVDVGTTEGVVPKSLIKGLLLDLKVGTDSVLHQSDLPPFSCFYLGENALKVFCVDHNHVIVPATENGVLLPERFCGLFQVVDFKVQFVLLLELLATEVSVEIFDFGLLELGVFLLKLAVHLLYLLPLRGHVLAEGLSPNHHLLLFRSVLFKEVRHDGSLLLEALTHLLDSLAIF